MSSDGRLRHDHQGVTIMTPIQRDTKRKQQAQQQAKTAPAAAVLPLDRTMRYKLGSDRARLKKIASMQRKAEVKAEIIPDYLPYVDGQMAAGMGDEILTQVMIWAYDANQIASFTTLARYALNNGIALPTEFARSLGAWLVESTSKLMLSVLAGDTVMPAADSTVLADLTLWLETETAAMDMHDEIRAKLYRACGELLFTTAPSLALEHFETALKLDSHIRVKKRIKALNESRSPQGQAADSSNSVAPPQNPSALLPAVSPASTATDGAS